MSRSAKEANTSHGSGQSKTFSLNPKRTPDKSKTEFQLVLTMQIWTNMRKQKKTQRHFSTQCRS